MKKQYITPTTTVIVCSEQHLLSASIVYSNVDIEWGEVDLTGLESDAPLLDILLDNELTIE